MLTSPAPCPTPIGCLTPEPCSEVLDAQCIVYTGPDLQCGLDDVVLTNTSLNLALEDIISYFCNLASLVPITVVEAGDGIDVQEDTVGTTTTYTVSSTGVVKFVKEFTSTLDGTTVTILGTELAACGIPTTPCNDEGNTSDFTYNIAYLDAGVWYNITNVLTVELTVIDATGNVVIVLAAPSSGDPLRVRVTIIG